MTISNEPDEDADSLDDHSVVDSFLGTEAPVPATKTANAPAMPDWPALRLDCPGMALDDRTMSWFKANHPDWLGQIAAVLRAWVDAQENVTIPKT